MDNLLTRWLEKNKVSTPEELDNTPMPDGSPTEREVFEEWRKALSKKEFTLADLKEYIQGQIGVIETKWADYEYKDKEQLIPYHTVYRTLLGVIDSPQTNRAALEEQLNKLTK
jgi:hypothetical protein